MPAYTKQFQGPDHYEMVIIETESKKKVGTIRVKPTNLLWKPANKQKFFSVSFEQLESWICENGRPVTK